MEEFEGEGKKDRLVAQLASNFFGMVTLNMPTTREANVCWEMPSEEGRVESTRKNFCSCILGNRRWMYEEETFCADKTVETETDKKWMKQRDTESQGPKRQGGKQRLVAVAGNMSPTFA